MFCILPNITNKNWLLSGHGSKSFKMPLINHSEPDKIFRGTTTRIHAPKINVKKKSQDTLKNFSVKPFPPSTPKDPRHISGTALPNSTVRNSVLHLEPNKISKNEDFKMKNEVDNKKKIIQSTDESSTSTLEFNLGTITLNKSNSRILELKARHQKLLSSSQDIKDDVAAFEPRRPTMQSIKEAIEKAKQLEINRHKNVGTTDDFQNISMSDASTGTDSRKGKKKKTLSKFKRTDSSTTSSLQISRTKSKPKKKKKVNNDNKKEKAVVNKKP